LADSSAAPESRTLLVTAGVLRQRGRVLVARRSPGRHLAGLWEFPGGKLESGESPEACLEREFIEEFGVQVKAGQFLLRSAHTEPLQTVELLVYQLRHVRGRFKLLAHDALLWCPRHHLLDLQLAPADIPVARALTGSRRTRQAAGRRR
jgi:8-oxo-dGTP diphosphatase